MVSGIRAAVFDAYGTLFDVLAPTARAAADLGDKAGPLGQMWRDKQLQYTWLRSLQGEYLDFRSVTADALDYAMEAVGIADGAVRARLLDLYQSLDAYPDAVTCLEGLKAKGITTAILSNGSPDMLDAATRSAGLEPLLDHVLSVESVGINKPDHRVYQLAVDTLRVAKDEILFVSGNGWDGKAAANFGFRVVWLNRAGLPEDRLPGTYAARVTKLTDLAAQIDG